MKREETINALLQNIEAISRTMMNRKAEGLTRNMPTHAQLGILLVLQYKGPQSIKELAGKFNMTSSAATQLVTGLVKDGMLSRSENLQDRRKIYIAITGKGKKTLTTARKQREKNILKLFESLSDIELVELEKIHRKITSRLQSLWT